ncbi:MAG: type II secretion system F family protein [Candidatus Poribacteria bacterium]|nr:type II secretion system F family protein [Candidatus Poribacteria bacterium]
MPRFRYEALTNTGTIVSNTQEANSKAELVSKLKVMGYWPTTVVEESAEAQAQRQFQIPLLRPRIKSADVEFFTYQIATLINAHVPLPRALGVTLEQITSIELKRVVEQVKYDVEHGATFNDALAQHPRVFSDLYINMVKAGEAAGVLGVVLARLAEFSERQRFLRSEVTSALFYPAILLVLSGGAVAVLITFVIPKFTSMFAELGVELPGPTRLLISVTDFLSAYWWVILIGGIGAVLALRQYMKTESGRLVLDRLKLKLPIIGGVFSTFALVRFTQTMATLLENGVVLLPALRVVKDTMGNLVYSHAVAEAEREVERGSTLSRELESSGVFPPLLTHMIAIGEESGNPEQMLAKLAEYYDMEIKKNLVRITNSIGPLVILFMGLLIGFIAVAMILPIFEASTAMEL